MIAIRYMKGENLCERVVECILGCDDMELSRLDEARLAGIFRVKREYLEGKFEVEQQIDLKAFILRERLYRAFFFIEGNCEISTRELAKKLGFLGLKSFVREFKNLFLVEPDKCFDLKKKRRASC